MFKEMVNSGYFMYMAEAEGYHDLVNTRTAAINSIIKDFKYIINSGVENPNNYKNQIFAKYGLTEEMLTDAECQKIMNAIRK